MKTNEAQAREMWPIDQVKPNPDNARVHSDDQITELAASLREFGWVRRIVVDEDGIMLIGHGMHRANRLAVAV